MPWVWMSLMNGREVYVTTGKSSNVYIVDGARTPFLKAGKRGPFSASDLAVGAGKALLARQPFSPSDLDEVITGCMNPSENEANISRVVTLRLGCGDKVPAWTVQRNCASGLQAIDNAFQDILLGRSNLVLAGGTEAMSRSPFIVTPELTDWLIGFQFAKSIPEKLQLLLKFPFKHINPIVSLMKGLTDPVVGLSMGQTAENVAFRFGITREEMDAFALRSNQRLAAAYDNHYLDEIVTLYDEKGKFYEEDTGMRRDTTLEKLGNLKPYFDKKFGMVTAGNSSQVTDGAAYVIVASEEAVKKYKLPILARIVATEWSALSPAYMGLGPAHAIASVLTKNQLSLKDVDYVEINEAFAAQVIGCLRAWQDESYCKEFLGLDKPFGTLDEEKLNIDGGAIACGHPVGASGARVLLHLAHVLKRKKARYGVASLCIGGGQGGAMLIENIED